MKEIVRYRNLSWSMKIAIIGGWISILVNGIAFCWGFIEGMLVY